jgi:hypothetical protein
MLYATPGNQWTQVLPVPIGSRLVPLAQAAREMAEATGFSQPSVVAYILADIAPLLPSVRTHTKWPMSETLQTRRVQVLVEYNSPDVTYNQSRQIRRKVRAAWNVDKGKRLTDRDRQILAIVESLGGEPREAPAAFWKKAQDLWNAEEQGKKIPVIHKNWRATQNKYHRLLKRLPGEVASQQAFLQGVLCSIPEEEMKAAVISESR